MTDAHTAVFRVKYSKHILSYSGKKREAEVKLDYQSCLPKREVHSRRGRFPRPASARKFPPGEINVMDAGWNASAKRYTGGKILVANLPDVEIGSTIEVEFEITCTGKPFLADFESFELPDALTHKSFTLTAPEISRFRNSPAAQKASSGEEDQNRWRQTNFLLGGGKCPGASGGNPVAAGVVVLAPASDISSAMRMIISWKLHDTLLDRSRKSAKVAASCAPACRRREESFGRREGHPRFHRQIHPAGRAVVHRTPADRAFRRRHDAGRRLRSSGGSRHPVSRDADGGRFQAGVCAGIRFAAIKEIAGVAKKFPMPQNFQSPLVRVVVDGEIYYLNDTDQYAQLGTTAHDGKLGIVPGTRRVETIQAARAAKTARKLFTTYRWPTTAGRGLA